MSIMEAALLVCIHHLHRPPEVHYPSRCHPCILSSLFEVLRQLKSSSFYSKSSLSSRLFSSFFLMSDLQSFISSRYSNDFCQTNIYILDSRIINKSLFYRDCLCLDIKCSKGVNENVKSENGDF